MEIRFDSTLIMKPNNKNIVSNIKRADSNKLNQFSCLLPESKLLSPAMFRIIPHNATNVMRYPSTTNMMSDNVSELVRKRKQTLTSFLAFKVNLTNFYLALYA